MVDTVKFYLSLDQYNFDHRSLCNVLDEYEIITGSNGVERISGIFRNMRVNERRYVLQIEGSLPKLYHGHNYRPLSISELKDCIILLSDHLHLPIERMGISRVDISDSLEVRLKPKYYMECLVSHPHLSREPRGKNGVYFENKSRHITVYGKSEERISKKQPIPNGYEGRNWLRIEHVHKRDLTHWLPYLNNITGLYLPENYLAAVDHWSNQFNQISMVDTSTGKLDSLTDQMDYQRLLTISGMLARGGQLSVLRELDSLYDLGKYEQSKSGKTKLRRHKKQVYELFEEYNRLDPCFRSLKSELCEKVKQQTKRNKELLVY